MSIPETTIARYKKWGCESPKAILLLIHGLGGHYDRWQFLANFFSSRGVASYAIELKGFGESDYIKGHIESFDIYYDDIATLYETMRMENPGKKIFIVGESLGGLIAFLFIAARPQFFDGLICISPAFKNKMKFSILTQLGIFLALIYNPKKQFNVPFTAKMCTRDVVYQKVMESDEKEHRLATPKLFLNILLSQAQSMRAKNKITIPTLFLLAGKDDMVDSASSRKIFNGLKVKDKEIVEYPDMLHALPIDLGREKVFEDILKWTEARL